MERERGRKRLCKTFDGGPAPCSKGAGATGVHAAQGDDRHQGPGGKQAEADGTQAGRTRVRARGEDRRNQHPVRPGAMRGGKLTQRMDGYQADDGPPSAEVPGGTVGSVRAPRSGRSGRTGQRDDMALRAGPGGKMAKAGAPLSRRKMVVAKDEA